MDVILTDEQEQLIDNLAKWFHTRDKPYYSYSGPAGSGKTTVIKCLIDKLNLEQEEYIACAYVGKAVLQLLRHDLPACTIHSLIYSVIFEAIPPAPGDKDQRVRHKLRFELKSQLSPYLKLIIVDEATMVNDQMKDEILSFGIPVVFIGDMNQLPPVFGISSVMLYPDFVLTKIMRQAENDPIVMLSQRILHDQPLYIGKYGISEVVDGYEVDRRLIDNYDIIICAKNATREMLNNLIREQVKGITTKDPVLNDKMICRQNDWDLSVNGVYLTNGLIGYVKDLNRSKAHKGFYTIEFQPDFMDEPFEHVHLDLRYLRSSVEERRSYGISRYTKFEYGYAVTAHLIQGGQENRVLFVDEAFWDKEMTKKMRYTAITRAVKQITIVSHRPVYKPMYYNY